eukprot:6222622-Pyramimonas_sp.AAC.1
MEPPVGPQWDMSVRPQRPLRRHHQLRVLQLGAKITSTKNAEIRTTEGTKANTAQNAERVAQLEKHGRVDIASKRRSSTANVSGR